MAWLKLLFLLLVAFLVVALVRAFQGALRFRRRFDDSSHEAGERLRQQVEGMVPSDALREAGDAAERELLRRLCVGGMAAAERESVLAFLEGHAFHSVIHEQVFHALRELPADRPEVVREQLAARLTRQGFPDVDLQDFLSPAEPASLSTEELLRQLRRQVAKTG